MPNAVTPGEEGENKETKTEYVSKDEIANIVNAAVKSHLNRTLAKEIETAFAPIKATLAELSKPKEEPTPDPKSAKKTEDPPELLALKKQVSELTASVQRSTEEAAAAKRAALEEKSYNALQQELTGKVRPEALGVVMDVIRARGHLVNDPETGEPRFKVRTSLGKGLPEEDHHFLLKDGVAEFLKSKDAGLFIPPPNGGNGGRQPPQTAKAQQHSRPLALRYDSPASSEAEQDRRVDERLAAAGVSFDD